MESQGQDWATEEDHLVSGVGTSPQYTSYQSSLHEDDGDGQDTPTVGYEHADAFDSDTAWSTSSSPSTTGSSIKLVPPIPVPIQPRPQVQAPGSAVLYCEIPECPWSSNIKDDWINHIIQDHYGDNCPPQCSCPICNKEFDASRTSGGDRRANFVRRLEHIRKHLLKGNTGEGRYVDYEMRDHPVRLTHDDRPRFHPANYRSPKQEKKHNADNRKMVDQATEDHRRPRFHHANYRSPKQEKKKKAGMDRVEAQREKTRLAVHHGPEYHSANRSGYSTDEDKHEAEDEDVINPTSSDIEQILRCLSINDDKSQHKAGRTSLPLSESSGAAGSGMYDLSDFKNSEAMDFQILSGGDYSKECHTARATWVREEEKPAATTQVPIANAEVSGNALTTKESRGRLVTINDEARQKIVETARTGAQTEQQSTGRPLALPMDISSVTKGSEPSPSSEFRGTQLIGSSEANAGPILPKMAHYLSEPGAEVENESRQESCPGQFRPECRTISNTSAQGSVHPEKSFATSRTALSRHRCVWLRVQNYLSTYLQPRVPKGSTRVSWICRCGKRQSIDVHPEQQKAAMAFAAAATGPGNEATISCSSEPAGMSSSVSSQSHGASGGEQSTDEQSSPSSVSAAPSIGDTPPFIPAGTKKYMLLCVNTSLRQIKLANVDVTDVDNDEEIFQRLRKAYIELRGPKAISRLMKPTNMHYFQLIHLQKSKECVGNYIADSIPSRKEILLQEYAFIPPEVGHVPIAPHLFMHAFLDPGDHMGTLATMMLPKKLRTELSCRASQSSPSSIPHGWGFYIVEGLDRIALAGFTIVVLLSSFFVTVLWSAIQGDVQGGTGMGQYCVAVMGLGISTLLILERNWIVAHSK